jgi:hypothetical protein
LLSLRSNPQHNYDRKGDLMKFSLLKYIPFVWTFTRGVINNARHEYKIKKFDQTKEKIDTIEHVLIKIEKKLNESRNEIENLRREIMFSRILNLIMGIVIVFLVIFMR